MDIGIDDAYKLSNQLWDVEVEARIKGPIVRRDTVRRLLERYDMQQTTYTESRSKSSSGTQSVIYRSIDEGNVVCKSKIKSYKYYNQWVSIVVSIEHDMGDKHMMMEKHFVATKKTRYSHQLGGFRLDVTYFHDDDIYQVEVEVLDGSKEEFKAHIENVIAILQDSPMYISRKKFENTRDIVGGDGYYIPNYVEMNTREMHLKKQHSSDFSIYHGKYQKPVSLTNKRLRAVFAKDMYMTPKLDGVRRFVIVFNGMVYDMDPEYMHVRLLSTSTYTDPFPIIIDTELMKGKYFIIDACVINGRYVGDEDLLTRLKHARNWSKHLSVSINCEMKEYQPIRDNPVIEIDKFHEKYLDVVDGIIFTNKHWEYTQSVIKWKQQVTIDLIVNEDITVEERIVANTIDYSQMPIKDGKLVDGTGVYELEILDIIEDDMSLDLRILRFRDDKRKPNSSKVIINNVEAFELRDIWKGRTCKLMRQYHNNVKRKMLKIAHKCVVLDIGTGQGGDISKWKNMNKVYCVEPNKKAVTELKDRLTDRMRKKINIIQCSVSNVDKIYRRVDSVDVITLFFSINLFNKDDLNALMEIISKYKPKHVMGTFLDKSLVKCANRYPCYTISPNNDKYHIQLYNTRINQDEYYFGLDQLQLPGYRLAESDRLDEHVIMSENESQLSGMFRNFRYELM